MSDRSIRPAVGSALLLSIALLAGAGCGSGSNNNAVAPQFQPEVLNSADTFQFQSTGVTRVTQTLTYTWSNSGTQANVDQSCAITAGSGTLIVLDAGGTQVYSRDLNTGGSAATATGTAGAWTVRVVLSNVSGNLNFRLQKRA